uniref:Uncharacterized protein n=1 Tax=Aegilops tauschii subsp. strangulata TaxID=200361 RepID=A0A453R7K3_AEGTS
MPHQVHVDAMSRPCLYNVMSIHDGLVRHEDRAEGAYGFFGDSQ